ncbi:uncharacterized protein [Triticum aestivum]|uniref:uncharacterized protein isoform X2 n=1 Tax=Triticum aestivum TaxID=4565 RepID=UPI001D0144E2|nr:uncharacterized protein LOC123153485 isoform X2 [Triticum aestivum]
MLEVAAVVAMEGSPPASGVPRPRDQRDCQAEVIISRRAPPSLLVSHNGCGLPLPLDPALLLLRFRFQAVAYGRLSISILPIWSTGGEPGCVWRRWRPASAPYKPRQSSAEAMTSTGGEAARRESQQRHSVWGCVDLVMLEQGNRKHHIRNGVSNSQFTFLPKGFLLCCQYHWSWGLDFVNIKIWVLTSKRVVDLFT